MKEMTISIQEFIRRFLLHILPPHFMKIRYYGILGNKNKKKKLLKCKILTRTKIYKKKEFPTLELLKKVLGMFMQILLILSNIFSISLKVRNILTI